MRLPVILLLINFIGSSVFAQNSLYMPRNYEPAFEKGTRSLDGAPGLRYWQNRTDYKIRVELVPKQKRIIGEEDLTYINNSPDSLKMIRIKLAHDLYKKGGQRNDDVNPEDVTDGVEIKEIKLDGAVFPVKRQRRHDSFLDLRLEKPLPPKSTTQLSIAWTHTMPSDENATRECVCDASTFFVSYFFPQIAVYDDVRGWASTPYNGLQEFYNDFGNYDVTITLPKGYMAWATGEWQNAADMLQAPIMERFNRAHRAADVVPIFTEAELKAGGIFKKAKKHVFHYKATDVPDFTFAASDHYNWDATSVVVDDATGRRTFVSAAYDSKSQDFYKVCRIAANGVRMMSTYLPGYPFPYPCLTIFNGNDGMEYPMMVNDASVGDDDPTGLTVHESAHTYFPFMMGINEQEYAWMDEGWANFFESFTSDSLNHVNEKNNWYGFGAGMDYDAPLMVPTSLMGGRGYGIHAYSRPQMAYTVLLDQLGYDLFKQCMTEYMNRWKGKHPIPFDFFYTFNNASGQDLNWLWKPWFFEYGYPDLSIKDVERSDKELRQTIIVERKGAFPVPVNALIEYAEGGKETIHLKPEVWKNGETMVKIPCAIGKVVASVTLSGNKTPDSRPKDNVWPRK